MFDITGNDLMKVVLLHTIQDKAVMCKVLEGLEPRHLAGSQGLDPEN